MAIEPDVLSLPQVAARVGVRPDTVQRWARATGVDGKMTPGVSAKVLQLGPGGRWRVSRYELDRAIGAEELRPPASRSPCSGSSPSERRGRVRRRCTSAPSQSAPAPARE